jgi:hypothetical protein
VEAAEAELQNSERTWRGVALLQGVTTRWGKTESAAKARKVLQGLLDNEKQVNLIAVQGAEDEIRSVSAQARAFERFGKIPQAIEAWDILVRNHGDSAAGRKAAAEIKRLKK